VVVLPVRQRVAGAGVGGSSSDHMFTGIVVQQAM